MAPRCSLALLVCAANMARCATVHGGAVGNHSSPSESDAKATPPPTLDDMWSGKASFKLLRSTPVGAPGFEHVDAGTRVVVINSTWYLFGRWDQGATKKCPNGEISINVRASTDQVPPSLNMEMFACHSLAIVAKTVSSGSVAQGQSWGEPHLIAKPDETKVCIYADGSAIFDQSTETWHYLVQVLDVGGAGGWMGAHFSLKGESPFGDWVADPQNPVIQSGSLFKQICAGVGKHCLVGMIDEGTFHIVEKVGEYFYVTFHGYDYQRRLAARGVARTTDFQHWVSLLHARPPARSLLFTLSSSLPCPLLPSLLPSLSPSLLNLLSLSLSLSLSCCAFVCGCARLTVSM